MNKPTKKNKVETARVHNILFKFFGKIEMKKDQLGIFYSKFIVLNKEDIIKATSEIVGD